MHERNRERVWRAVRAAAMAAIALVVVLATAASYPLGAACALGAVGAVWLAGRRPYHPVLERLAAPGTGEPVVVRPGPWRPRLLMPLIVALVVLGGLGILFVLTRTRPQARKSEPIVLDTVSDGKVSATQPPPRIDSLVVEFSPSDRHEHAFRQRTTAYAGTARRPGAVREVASVPRGFLVREVRATLACPAAECPPARVRLLDLPAETFLAAENVTPPQSGRYFDSESVTWSQLERDADVRFAVLPPPYPILRPVLGPFIGLSGAGAWAGALFALILALLLYVVTKVAGDAMLDWVGEHLPRLRRPRAAPEPPPSRPELQPHGESRPPKKGRHHRRG